MSDPQGGEAGRVRCLYCGANNFPSSPTCWQCGRALQSFRSPDVAPRAAVSADTFGASVASARAGAADRVDGALAAKAAAALGLMFPYVALPVGIVFLMLDDPRKTQLGWITIGWSLAGTALNAVLFFATLGPALALMKSALPHPGGFGPIPGLPTPGGDPPEVNLLPALFSQLIRPPLLSW